MATNGDIAMQSSGTAMHIGFGGDSSLAGPKWVGHFGHDRFDYVWDTTYPHIEEDWISVEDIERDFDIITHSYEDANLYDPSSYGTPGQVYHNYLVAAKFSGSSLYKICLLYTSPSPRD